MKTWKRVEPTETYNISYRTIVTKTFKMSDGNIAYFGTIWPENQEFVAAIALTKENKAIVARMYRVGPERIMNELPGGCVDEGEDIIEAGARELYEETGYRAGEITYLGKSYKDAYMNATWHFIYVANCVLDPNYTHPYEIEEQIEVNLVSIDMLIRFAKEGKMTDAVGVLLAYERLKEIEHNDESN